MLKCRVPQIRLSGPARINTHLYLRTNSMTIPTYLGTGSHTVNLFSNVTLQYLGNMVRHHKYLHV